VHLQSTAYYTSAHVLDDGIIDPRITRDVLGMCLEVVLGNGIVGNSGFGGVSRL
jgi:acetyl-CoA carboxylase carboxyltransferase component